MEEISHLYDRIGAVKPDTAIVRALGAFKKRRRIL